MKVIGLSVIANDAFPYRRVRPKDLGHESVLRVVEQSAHSVRTILEGVIEEIGP
jgi:purine nucleoside phosphorylase